MPAITINGTTVEFEKGEKILAVANRLGLDIPQYCYHEGLSIPAQCRICLAEIWAPNPRNTDDQGNPKLEPMAGGKLMPTCSTDATDGMVVYTDNPKAVANQKAVMEFLLINHPLDCPVCDQAGECSLQDYSYEYGRGVSRFEESKVKQPKKDLGPNVLIYSDRCIMCTRCVRFTREVPETAEITIDGRGNKSQIDVFPGVPLENDLSANVIDLCPVGALLDKDFLFAQRVWFLKTTPSIDGLTASGDNLFVEHNEGRVYRLKPRTNMAVNKWWITDEVRYGWKFVHSEERLRSPMRKQYGVAVECDFTRAYTQVLDDTARIKGDGGRLAVVVSPMLSCEEAYALATLARRLDAEAELVLGPVPFGGEDKAFPPSLSPDEPDYEKKVFRKYAEKAPNARGVRRVLQAINEAAGKGPIAEANQIDDAGAFFAGFGSVILTGNYPTAWATPELVAALQDKFLVLIDTLRSDLVEAADVVLPGATWVEKAGTFENARGQLQAFEQAIPVIQMAKAEGQIATDLLAMLDGEELDRFLPKTGVLVVDEQPGQVPNATAVVAIPRAAKLFNAADARREMAQAVPALGLFTTDVAMPAEAGQRDGDMAMVEL